MQTIHTSIRNEPVSPGQLIDHLHPTAPNLMVVVDHHAAKIYRIDVNMSSTPETAIKPYDPHHFQHHRTHKNQSREAGQRTPEEYSFYEQIAKALEPAGKIVVVGHGTGTSNAAHHLTAHLRSHHHGIYDHIVREVVTDLSSITPPQLFDIARQALL